MVIGASKSAIVRMTRVHLVAVGQAWLIVILMHSPALAADEPNLDASSSLLQQQSTELAQTDPGTPNQDHLWTPAPVPDRVWTIDYQLRYLTNSKTVYEFGTPEPAPEGWTPLSRLEFPVSALWHGLKLGLRQPNWNVHFEWLTPMAKNIQGDLYDYDWMDPEADYTDLGIMQQRWIDGQMADLGVEFRAWERCFGMPVDFWPTIGFRWQRFNIMAYDLVQVKQGNVWPPDPYTYQGDVISFNQQYYLTYLGGQLRGVLNSAAMPPIAFTFQADWADAQAYNVDHHLLREGDRYTMERTHGDSWHLALTAEAPITKHITIGCQADYLQIRTRGKHHWLNVPMDQDETWTNGVRVWSDQTWLTAYLGVRL